VHLIVGADELFLLGPNPMITVLSGLEGAVEASSLGISGEEGGVLLGEQKGPALRSSSTDFLMAGGGRALAVLRQW
jgi:hypothetical protein